MKLFTFVVGLKNLDFLGLAHNKIVSVPGEVFVNLTKLNSLDLEGNGIIEIEPNAFMGLEGISVIFLNVKFHANKIMYYFSSISMEKVCFTRESIIFSRKPSISKIGR